MKRKGYERLVVAPVLHALNAEVSKPHGQSVMSFAKTEAGSSAMLSHFSATSLLVDALCPDIAKVSEVKQNLVQIADIAQGQQISA